MKWILIAAAMFGLAGCATYSELQNQPAKYSGNTAKNAGEYLGCVMPRWAEKNPSAHVIADGDSQVVVVNGDGVAADNTIATLTVKPSEAGTSVQWRDGASRGDAYAARRDAVTDCM